MTREYTRLEYGSTAEVAAHIVEPAGWAPVDALRSRKDRGESWDFGVGWDGAMRLIETGWLEGRERVEAQADQLREDVMRLQRVVEGPAFVSGMAGSVVNIPAHIAGRPDAMLGWRNVPKEQVVVRIHASLTASGGYSADDYERRGAAAAALIDLLEMTGTRCEVVAAVHVKEGASFTITIKEPEHPPDMDAIAFWLAHPAALRRVVFALMELDLTATARDRIGVSHRGGYGTPADAPDDHRVEGEVYIPKMLYGEKRYDAAWIRDVMAHLGVLSDDD